MNEIDNSKIQDTDISLGLFLETLATAKDLPLVFHYDGRSVKGGYHVTEVKAGQFAALDCGGQSGKLDRDLRTAMGYRTHMLAAKFAAIISKVSEQVKFDGSAKLTFELSDGVQPIQLYEAAYPSLCAGRVLIELAARQASFKPRNRWLAEEAIKTAACCGPSSQKSA